MIETTINLYPITVIICILLILCISVFLIHSGFNINLFVKKDEKIAEKFLDKFPLVTPEFLQKNTKEQNIENNQEIHEINKRLEIIEETLQELRKKKK